MTISLADLNFQKKCEDAVDFEPTTPTGKGLGFTLKVIGSHAPAVQKWVNKHLNDRRRAEALQAKRKGKGIEYTPIEDDIDFGVELVAIRVVGWEGIEEPWSPENALLLCRTNADVCAQVREFSEDIANFTKG